MAERSAKMPALSSARSKVRSRCRFDSSDRHDLLADRPQGKAGELEMRPGEGDADDRHRQEHRGDEVAEREPPAREHEPDDVADDAERAGAGIALAGHRVTAHRLRAER